MFSYHRCLSQLYRMHVLALSFSSVQSSGQLLECCLSSSRSYVKCASWLAHVQDKEEVLCKGVMSLILGFMHVIHVCMLDEHYPE